MPFEKRHQSNMDLLRLLKKKALAKKIANASALYLYGVKNYTPLILARCKGFNHRQNG
jgi:hypothetical protein